MTIYLLFTLKKTFRGTFECNSDLCDFCVPLSAYADPSYRNMDLSERIAMRFKKMNKV